MTTFHGTPVSPTFTTDLATDIGKVRFAIGDSLEGTGPRPNQRNFSDAEISATLSLQDDDIDHTVLSLLKILANEWSTFVDYQVGPRKEWASQAAKAYATRVDELEQRIGTGTTFSVGLNRDDGYAEDYGGPTYP